MKKKLRILGLATASLLILTGCIRKNSSKAHYLIEKDHQITDSYYYDLDEKAQEASLEIAVKLEEGQVRFELTDPQGQLQWSQEIDSSQPFKEKKNLEKIAGRWDLNFQSIDQSASGELALEFNSK